MIWIKTSSRKPAKGRQVLAVFVHHSPFHAPTTNVKVVKFDGEEFVMTNGKRIDRLDTPEYWQYSPPPPTIEDRRTEKQKLDEIVAKAENAMYTKKTPKTIRAYADALEALEAL
jgi:hypothetical protein